MVLGCAMLGLSAVPAPAATFEQQVLIALNAARANPGAMADALRTYRSQFRGKLVRYAGSNVSLMTQEGVTPVDEAIDFLSHQSAVTPLAATEGLADGAAEHVADQGARGGIGHGGSDGSSPFERIERHGGQQNVAEVIQYGADQPIDVIRQLIVDDGVASRDHRRILFDPGLRFAGVACGLHRDYGRMCVIDFATSSVESRSAQTYPPARVAFQTPR